MTDDTARELHLFMANCAPAWRMAEAAFRNYEGKRQAGAYDPALARKGLAYAVTMAAKEYAREHLGDASDWCSVFPPETRQTVADLVMTDAEFEWSVGNHCLVCGPVTFGIGGIVMESGTDVKTRRAVCGKRGNLCACVWNDIETECGCIHDVVSLRWSIAQGAGVSIVLLQDFGELFFLQNYSC